MPHDDVQYDDRVNSRRRTSHDDTSDPAHNRVSHNDTSGARLGDFFELHGEMLQLPPGQGFSIYSLAALLPLLPAKQRVTVPNDWMTSDAEVACPDPNCPTRFRITRTGRRYFKRSDTTAVPLPTQDSR